MRAYSNNGYSFRAWNTPATIAAGEVYFDHVPTDAELTAAFPAYDPDPPPPREAYRLECARRIETAASLATQLNLNAYANVLNAKATLTSGETADLAVFAQAVQWIAAMRATWKALADAGDRAFKLDSKWPALPAPVAALAARF